MGWLNVYIATCGWALGIVALGFIIAVLVNIAFVVVSLALSNPFCPVGGNTLC